METPNLNYIESLADGDLVFKEKLIRIIKFEFPQEETYYLQALKAKNFRAAAEVVHKLKNKISMFGLEQCYSLALVHEEELKINRNEQQASFELVLNCISDYLKDI
jgi:hypothetical protein